LFSVKNNQDLIVEAPAMKRTPISIIKNKLAGIEVKMLAEVEKRKKQLESLHPDQQIAAKNLFHYMVLRNEDIRELQDQLHIHGLSSLASSESHIHRQLQAILERLGVKYKEEELDLCTYDYSKRSLDKKSKLLFGTKPEKYVPTIMVTFDTSFADNYAQIKSLLQNGMNVARINCAHDDEQVWSKMIAKLRKACKSTGLECKVYMDLAGPKIRTTILGRGKVKGKVKVSEGELIWLADNLKDVEQTDVVISPTEKNIVTNLKKGDRVYIDDGRIRAVVEKIKGKSAGIRITRISADKKRIKTEKGINFPDTKLSLPSLTDFDKSCLPFISEHADLVGYSFVKTAEDIATLRKLIIEMGSKHPAIIVKIENLEAVNNLPFLLFEGMRDKAFGVMIARGDLAVEIGFERMVEIQEEILWICEAAHMPVVWATQVLETLNKSGMATRSEITDAGHAALADCVMINKGEHTVEVIEMLKDIVKRTSAHRIKKRFTFRPLNIAARFIGK
jgi:pyruvate kinase